MQLRIPHEPPNISPVYAKENRPQWSVMIPVYNCSKWIHEVLESVLIQNIPEEEMQIEVIDDASTDADVEAIVQETGKGRIKYFRQEINVGSLRNFETCINRSIGYNIHLLHGDDKIKLGYYAKIGKLLNQYPEAGSAFCRFSYINKNSVLKSMSSPLSEHEGILDNWLVRIAEQNHIQYAAITVRREVYERLGAFFGSTGSEDWEMWVRIAKYYQAVYTPDCLAEYREHDDSITGNKFLNGETLSDINRVMHIVQSYLPSNKREEVLNRSKKVYAKYGYMIAVSTWIRTQNKILTLQILNQTIKFCKKDMSLYWIIAKLYVKVMIGKKIFPEKFD